MSESPSYDVQPNDVAVTGMAGHFPGAPDPDQLWKAVEAGEDLLTRLRASDAIALGVSPSQARDPDYVLRDGVLENVDHFDPDFFGIGKRDAAIMDPQHRHFIECCWEALESATQMPETFEGNIGIFAGCGMNTYLLHNLLTNPKLVEQMGWFLLRHTANDKDFLSTTASYHLGLEGPSINVQTACSTSLVAVHLAIQSLVGFECDLALAGGSTIEFPHGSGYMYREGEILAQDGYCRAYDAKSGGTVLTGGAGVVALRRLEDALEEGDPVLAILKGSAVNNDGRRKVSYLAPSVDGHADVVREALSVADVDARSIQLVEGHGTGTAIGDPIEVAALTEAFRGDTDDTGFCRLVSTKPNIGHLDTAAGSASLIKVVQALRNQVLPPLANFTAPSEMVDVDQSPFVISGEAAPWDVTDGPRRAGVSSLGVGGTNAHVIVQEAPPLDSEEPGEGPVALLLSGKTVQAVDDAATRLADYLENNPKLDLHAVANTLKTGRRRMETRRVVMVSNTEDAIAQLRAKDRANTHTATVPETTEEPKVVFMFPGGGTQYVGMGAGLDETFTAYHETMKTGIEHVRALDGPDLTELMAPDADPEQLRMPSASLPAVFLTSVALARQWMAWGSEPSSMLGHSLGEYVAAHLAGVLSLEDALKLVVVRSRLMEQATGQGAAMMVVPMTEEALVPLLTEELSLATVNATDECVVAGPVEPIEALLATLADEHQIDASLIPLSAAAHSSMLDPVLPEFLAAVQTIELNAPSKPYISNLTGTWITPDQAMDPQYWVDHLRNTVRFAAGMETVLAEGSTMFVELGPGHSLASYARRSEVEPTEAISVLRHPNHDCDDSTFTQMAFARHWIGGADKVNLDTWTGAGRRRITLPTYPFQRERCWIEPGLGSAIGRPSPDGDAAGFEGPERIASIDDMFWAPSWEPAPELSEPGGPAEWFILGSGSMADALVAELRARDHTVVLADVLGPEALEGQDRVVVMSSNESGLAAATNRWVQDGAAAAKALAASGSAATLVAMTSGALAIQNRAANPLDALALGVMGTAPKEYPGLTGRLIDADPELSVADQASILADELIAGDEPVVAMRNGDRLTPDLARVASTPVEESAFRHGGTYLITGGLGGIGFELASYLAETYSANLVITSSSPLPEGRARQQWLAAHGYQDPTSRRIRKLAELEAITKVALVVVDLDTASDVTTALDAAERLVGDIDGAVHAAGRLRDRLIEFAEPEDHEVVVRAKVQGALSLIDDLDRRGAGMLVLLSSTSTFLKPEGQASYVAANSVLDSLAGMHNRLQVSTLNYGVWAGTGLAAEAARRARLGLEEGDAIDHPVFEQWTEDRTGALVYAGRLETEHHWVVNEHRTETGLAVLPGTGQIDLLLAAARLAGLEDHRLGSVALLEPLVVPDEGSVTLRVVVGPAPETASAGRAIRLESDGGTGQSWYVHGEGELLAPADPASNLDLAALRSRIQMDSFEPLVGPRRHLQLGQRWDAIVEAHRSEDEALATLQLDDPDEAALWDAHPALVDVATALGVALGIDDEELLYVPIGYEEVRRHQRIPGRCVAYAQRRGPADAEVLQVDVVVADPDGSIAIDIRGLQLRPISAPAALGESDHEIVADSGDMSPLIALAETLGIGPSEGAEMLERVAGGSARRLIGSTVDVDELMIEPEAASSGDGGSDGDGGSQATTVDGAVSEIWADLLGLPTVGPDDDFFDLGGHSLIAIRVMAQIHRQLGVRFQLATIFEAPTVAEMAELIRAQRPDIDAQLAGAASSDTSDAAAGAAPSEAVVQESRSLIPISRKGDSQPMFIVHGAGGNILFLSTLARAMAGERPIYGFQARGIDESEEPDKTLDEMADRYVAELTAAHEGPYLLGGYSGGGQVALEMAKRLQAAGHTITGVILFDSVPAGKALVSSSDARRNILNNLRTGGFEPLKPYLSKYVSHKLRRFRPRDSAFDEEKRELGYRDSGGDDGFVNLYYYFSEVADRHETGQYDVDVIVLKADNQWPVQPADYYWSKHVSGRRIYRLVPGGHHTMFFPENATVMADELRSAMTELGID